MGKPTGFLDYERKDNNASSPLERIKHFGEFHSPLDENERREQGGRCMNCGVPFCQSGMMLSGMLTGCPLHNLIPEWNDAVFTGDTDIALSRLLKTNNFPEFTGRVCPALCEKACICGKDGSPVTVRENELYIIENAFEKGLMQPKKPAVRSKRSVAVVGSGPAGLAVADLLSRRGHDVTVFERDDRIGGLLMYGIPNMKLEKHIISRRVELMEAQGVRFVTGADIGRNIDANEILERFDAVALCCGAKKPRGLGVDIKGVSGVHYAVDFLTSVTKGLLSGEGGISAEGLDVLVVGGGDTGNDCVGTCIRQGCRSVTQLEIMPKPPVERSESNPWPEWPKVLKTDYGQEEAIAVFGSDPRVYCTTVKELICEDGTLKAVRTVEVKRVDGRMAEVEGSEKVIKCELLLIAAGFVGCDEYVPQAFGLGLTPRGNVESEGNSSAKAKVFTAGDMRIGQSLVVRAIADGRECAYEIDRYLMGYSNIK